MARHFVHERTILFGECDPAGILYTPCICEYVVESALLFLTTILEQPFERYIFSQSMSLPARASSARQTTANAIATIDHGRSRRNSLLMMSP